jgi:hypothetical protein
MFIAIRWQIYRENILSQFAKIGVKLRGNILSKFARDWDKLFFPIIK